MPIIILDHFLNLIFLSALVLIAAGIGNFILQPTRLPFDRWGERLFFATGTGLGLLSMSVFLLGAFQMLNPKAVCLLLGAFLIPATAGWRWFCGSFQTDTSHRPELAVWDRFAGMLLFILMGAALFCVLTPAVGNDALSYHLAVPGRYLAHGGFDFIPGNIFSNYPLNGEMLYLVALVLRGDILAKGIHFLAGLLILSGMWQFTGVYLKPSPFRFLPLLIFFSIPTVFAISHTAYTDLFLALYAFLSLYAFLNWMNRRHTGWLILCSVGTGLAIGSKYGGLFLPFLGTLAVLVADNRHRARTGQTLFHVALFIVITGLVGSAFYVKNWVLTGNPLYPFFYTIFDGKGWDAVQARRYNLFLQNLGMGRGWIDYLLLPWNLSFRAKTNSPLFDGVLGPIFFLTLPFTIGIRKRPYPVKICLFFCGSCFLFWAASAQQMRYLIPVFPPLSLITGYIAGYFQKRKIMILFLVFVAAGLGVNGYHIGEDFNRLKPIRYLTGKEDRSQFLSRMIPSYEMFQTINSDLPKDARVFFIYMKNPGFLCQRAYYSDSIFESYTIEKILNRSETPESVYMALKRRGVTHILYDAAYVQGPYSTFSETDKRRFAGFQDRYLEFITSDKNRYFLYKLKGPPPITGSLRGYVPVG